MARATATDSRRDDTEPIARPDDIVDVRVALAGDGGWDVVATMGGRILTIQHCKDWHRAERAYVRMSGDARLHRVEAA